MKPWEKKNTGWGRIDVNFNLVKQSEDGQSGSLMVALQQNCIAFPGSFCVVLFPNSVASSGEPRIARYQIHFQATSLRKGKKLSYHFEWMTRHFSHFTDHNSQWQERMGNVFVMAGMCLAEIKVLSLYEERPLGKIGVLWTYLI